MTDKNIFTVTTDHVEQWRAEKAALEKKISESNARLAAINAKLQAVEILANDAGTPATASVPAPEDASNLTDAVERVANESAAPLTKAQLKSRLRVLGFPDSRLANYLYTVIARLKTAQKISVTTDGRIWRAQK